MEYRRRASHKPRAPPTRTPTLAPTLMQTPEPTPQQCTLTIAQTLNPNPAPTPQQCEPAGPSRCRLYYVNLVDPAGAVPKSIVRR